MMPDNDHGSDKNITFTSLREAGKQNEQSLLTTIVNIFRTIILILPQAISEEKE